MKHSKEIANDKKLFIFTEHNDWEGESWNFYIDLTEEDEIFLRKVCEYNDEEFSLSNEREILESEALIMEKYGAVGDLPFHIHLGMLELPKDQSVEDFADNIYKGSIQLYRVDK